MNTAKFDHKKIILAFSGGLDTTTALHFFAHQYPQTEIIAYCADVGMEEETDGLEAKALALGAKKCILADIAEDFIRDYYFPALQMNAMYEGKYLLGTSLARPTIAKGLVELAHQEGADTIMHFATFRGNDQVRFELSINALDPALKVLAPWRRPDLWPFKGRKDMVNYCKENGLNITASIKKTYSMDRNLLHISFESQDLEDPWVAPDLEHMWVMTKPVSQAKNEPEDVVISFEQGIPVAVNGERLSPAQLMRKLNKIGCDHAIGTIDIVETRFTQMKSRGVYNTPAGTILLEAHRDLETICMDGASIGLKNMLMPKYAELCYNGFWFAPEREMIQALCTESQRFVTGDVRVNLFKGAVMVNGRRSPYSLYDESLATFEDDLGLQDPTMASGYIAQNAMRLKVLAHKQHRYTTK